jgi:hypothetical protein
MASQNLNESQDARGSVTFTHKMVSGCKNHDSGTYQCRCAANSCMRCSFEPSTFIPLYISVHLTRKIVTFVLFNSVLSDNQSQITSLLLLPSFHETSRFNSKLCHNANQSDLGRSPVTTNTTRQRAWVMVRRSYKEKPCADSIPSP